MSEEDTEGEMETTSNTIASISPHDHTTKNSVLILNSCLIRGKITIRRPLG